MKLVQALNGDWINLDLVQSFNVADFGTRSIVFARIGNQSYELFVAYSSTSNPDPAKFLDWDSDIPNPDYIKQAEEFLQSLTTKTEAIRISIDPVKDVQDLVKTMEGLEKVLNPPKPEEKFADELIANQVYQNPEDTRAKKRTTRKPKHTGEEG